MLQSDFNKKKALEAILYLKKRLPKADLYAICKLLYLVDKTSLEKYGRFLFGESYCAMKEGAVPSNAYNLLRSARTQKIDGIKVNANEVKALRNPKVDFLSESDIECLDQVINVYGNVPGWKLRQEAHDEAWEESWKKRGKKGSAQIPIETIAKYLDDTGELGEYLTNCG